jgi:integral membrane sensor domain MASE1
VSVLYATHVHAYSGLGAEWLIYWLGDATGALLVTPLVLTIRDFVQRYQPAHFFCGHIHEAEGVSIEIGPTRAHNVGKKAYLLELE